MKYLVIFLLEKSWQFLLCAAAWSLVPLVPLVSARIHLFDCLLIVGRCRAPLSACGQDNVALAYVASALVPFASAIGVTVLVSSWYDDDWVRRRQELKSRYQQRQESIPEKPDISSLGEGR